MGTPPTPDAVLIETALAVRRFGGNQVHAAEFLRIPRSTLQNRLRQIILRDLELPPEELPPAPEPIKAVNLDRVRQALKLSPTLGELAERIGCSRGAALDAIDALRGGGYAVIEDRSREEPRYRLNVAPQAAVDTGGGLHTYKSREDGSYIFGFTSDNHLGSKYTRLDALDALFERFAEVGVDRVFHAGNWIEGEAHENTHDLTHHGIHQQCAYLADRWPRKGITTYAVSGNDHEGWYAKREGIDVGRYAEQAFRDAGREDWVDVGYMEADIALVNYQTGVVARLRNAHPGGGSAYAHSYAPQKYIESLSSGEKPAVVLLGHYHKLSCNNIRGVWVIQTGCTQDQTPWARQRKLDYHVGGGICRLVQDPDSGAILSCTVELIQFFNREFYGTGRWSPHGPIRAAEKSTTA